MSFQFSLMCCKLPSLNYTESTNNNINQLHWISYTYSAIYDVNYGIKNVEHYCLCNWDLVLLQLFNVQLTAAHYRRMREYKVPTNPPTLTYLTLTYVLWTLRPHAVPMLSVIQHGPRPCPNALVQSIFRDTYWDLLKSWPNGCHRASHDVAKPSQSFAFNQVDYFPTDFECGSNVVLARSLSSGNS